MRARIVLFVLAVALAVLGSSCGDSSTSSSGTVVFQMDAITCSVCARGAIRLLIDGNQVGTMQCSGTSTTSLSFSVSPGSHSISASDNSGTWGPITTDIPSGGSHTFDMNC